MSAWLIKKLTGRAYSVPPGELRYLLEKGGVAALRGLVWKLLRLRRWRGFMLGPNVQIVMGSKLQLGKGVSIGGGSYLDCAAINGIVLAEKVTLREGVWIQGRSGMNPMGDGLSVGRRTYIGPRAVFGIGGPIIIGEDIQAGAGLNLIAESHAADGDGSFVTGHVARKGISIGDRCWIGNNVIIIDGVKVGADCIIGAGSVVTRSLPAGCKAYGVPARIIG
jgi:acetyltransferase-like isoleucine patch superfamily enzyme